MEVSHIEPIRNIARRKRVMGLELDPLNLEETLRLAVRMGRNREKGFFCFANVHMASEAEKSAQFAFELGKATAIVADGVPLVWALKNIHQTQTQRVAGMDFLPEIIRVAEKEGLSVFFYGDNPHTLSIIKEKLSTQHPKLKIAGTLAPPKANLEALNHAAQIEELKPHLVFVALGCPKQELWMAENSAKINAPLFGLGAAFKVYAGLNSRAPQWMQNMGLEWLYRLFQEPRRLFKRYLSTNFRFIWWFFRNIFKSSG